MFLLTFHPVFVEVRSRIEIHVITLLRIMKTMERRSLCFPNYIPCLKTKHIKYNQIQKQKQKNNLLTCRFC